MEKTFRPYEPRQIRLLPPNLAEWLPADHLARFIDETVDRLDLREILDSYSEERGYPPYHPVMMVKVLLYAYATGVYSSRKIERKLYEDVAFRYLGAENFPDHKTISEFRRRHLPALRGLFLQVVEICRKLGMVKMGHLCIDSTKVRANASKHKAMSYGRMKQEKERLEREIGELLRRAEEADVEEDRRYGDDRGDELPEELRHRETRLRKIEEAIRALEREAKEAHGDEAVPEEKAQRNFTDPDSRIMRSAGGTFEQAYQVQVAVDPTCQVIVATDVSPDGSDAPKLLDMVAEAYANTGVLPTELSADAGYFSETNVTTLEEVGIEPLIPPNKIRHTERRSFVLSPPTPVSEDASVRERMAGKLRDPEVYRRYQERQKSVEPTFGQIKEVRGFRRFSLRGLPKVQAEWFLVAAVHNLLKIYRYQWATAGVGTA
jgi:transposase